MAIPHCTRAASPSFLHLPPALRIIAFQRANVGARSFSLTRRRHADAITIITAGPTFVMDSLHNLGLSWSMAIPCAALLLRGGLAFYLVEKPQRKRRQQQTAIMPLMHAYTVWYRESPKIQKKLDFYLKKPGLTFGLTPLAYKAWTAMKAARFASSKMGYLTGQDRWRRITSSQWWSFGLLITTMEAIRLKFGAREGILALFLWPFRWVGDNLFAGTVAPGTTSVNHTAPLVPASETSDILKTVPSLHHPRPPATAENSLEDFDPLASVNDAMTAEVTSSVSTTLADPSMQTEGPWFCPDLTSVDPSGILSFGVLAAVAIPAYFSPQRALPSESTGAASATVSTLNGNSNVSPTTRTQEHTTPIARSWWQRTTPGTKFKLVFAVYMASASLQWPVALSLYVISNWSISFVQRVWLEVRHPIVKPIAPCARPVRKRQRRTW